MSINLIIAVSLAYTAFLFLLAYWTDRAAKRGEVRWLRSPLIYTLSLSVYCTAWTFYGAVGSAARTGFEFLTIYLGPTIAFVAWWTILRKMVRIGKAHNITSIADMISARFGKSNTVALIVTLIMLAATTPYISLQLQSITQSIDVLLPNVDIARNQSIFALLTTIVLSLFAVSFGTRFVHVSERHNGLVTAIAFESLVKLFAILAVGSFLILEFGGLKLVFETDIARQVTSRPIETGRWVGLVALSFIAILVLPRMFHVLVVENEDEANLATASWAFPLYMLALNIFVLPIAIIGLDLLPDANPDYFLIELPLASGRNGLALLSYIGGFSAATSMIIITSIAVATMVSNHVITPIWLDARGKTQNPNDVQKSVIRIRRGLIFVVILLGFAYYEINGHTDSLASIGLIAFVGVAQVFPSLIAGMYWRGATRFGAILGLSSGAILWFLWLIVPSVEAGADLVDTIAMSDQTGMLGFFALFRGDANDPVIGAFAWTMIINSGFLFVGSILTYPKPLEIIQGNQFVDALNPQRASGHLHRNTNARIEDIVVLSQRILGTQRTEIMLRNVAEAQGRSGDLPIMNDFFLEKFELAIGGVLGSSAAHMLITQLVGRATVPASETIKLADETIQTIEYARALEEQSQALEQTAHALREANASLIALDAQKDTFLSQISHELRTPMTSIRSFAEILQSEPNMSDSERSRLLTIIAEESGRLSSLLDDILDLSYIQSGRAELVMTEWDMRDALDQAIAATEPVWRDAGMTVLTEWSDKAYPVRIDHNRMAQVFINLITNAAKYAKNTRPELRISLKQSTKSIRISFIDNGPGIPPEEQGSIFEKFARGGAGDLAGSTGLGLAISREIVESHGGTLKLKRSLDGAIFVINLPH